MGRSRSLAVLLPILMPLRAGHTTSMRIFLLVVFLILSTSDCKAQDGGDTPGSSRFGEGFIAASSGSLPLAPGALGETTGTLHGGGGGFVGLQATPRLALTIDISVWSLDRREETVQLPSGLDVGINTTTDIVRVAVLSRYGPRFGAVHVYGEALAGINVISTQSSIEGRSQDTGGETQKQSAAPAAGMGLGIEVGLGKVTPLGLPIALHARGRYVFGGNAEYFAYDDTEGVYFERSSRTTTASFSIGLTLNFFRVSG